MHKLRSIIINLKHKVRPSILLWMSIWQWTTLSLSMGNPCKVAPYTSQAHPNWSLQEANLKTIRPTKMAVQFTSRVLQAWKSLKPKRSRTTGKSKVDLYMPHNHLANWALTPQQSMILWVWTLYIWSQLTSKQFKSRLIRILWRRLKIKAVLYTVWTVNPSISVIPLFKMRWQMRAVLSIWHRL